MAAPIKFRRQPGGRPRRASQDNPDTKAAVVDFQKRPTPPDELDTVIRERRERLDIIDQIRSFVKAESLDLRNRISDETVDIVNRIRALEPKTQRAMVRLIEELSWGKKPQ